MKKKFDPYFRLDILRIWDRTEKLKNEVKRTLELKEGSVQTDTTSVLVGIMEYDSRNSSNDNSDFSSTKSEKVPVAEGKKVTLLSKAEFNHNEKVKCAQRIDATDKTITLSPSEKAEIVESGEFSANISANEETLNETPQQSNSLLTEKKFLIRDVKGDGNCLFRCFSVVLQNHENDHSKIRKTIVKYVYNNYELELTNGLQESREDFVEDHYEDKNDYKKRMGRLRTLGTAYEAAVFAKIFNVRVSVYRKIYNEATKEIRYVFVGTYNDDNSNESCHVMHSGSYLAGHWQILYELPENSRPGADVLSIFVPNISEQNNPIFENNCDSNCITNDFQKNTPCAESNINKSYASLEDIEFLESDHSPTKNKYRPSLSLDKMYNSLVANSEILELIPDSFDQNFILREDDLLGLDFNIDGAQMNNECHENNSFNLQNSPGDESFNLSLSDVSRGTELDFEFNVSDRMTSSMIDEGHNTSNDANFPKNVSLNSSISQNQNIDAEYGNHHRDSKEFFSLRSALQNTRNLECQSLVISKEFWEKFVPHDGANHRTLLPGWYDELNSEFQKKFPYCVLTFYDSRYYKKKKINNVFFWALAQCKNSSCTSFYFSCHEPLQKPHCDRTVKVTLRKEVDHSSGEVHRRFFRGERRNALNELSQKKICACDKVRCNK